MPRFYNPSSNMNSERLQEFSSELLAVLKSQERSEFPFELSEIKDNEIVIAHAPLVSFFVSSMSNLMSGSVGPSPCRITVTSNYVDISNTSLYKGLENTLAEYGYTLEKKGLRRKLKQTINLKIPA